MTRMTKIAPFWVVALVVAVISGIGSISSVYAHGGAKGVVKERMSMMKSMADEMKKAGAMIKGKVPFDSEKIATYAQSIQQISPDINNLFPQGSIDKPSEALPAIWEEWDEFSALTNDLVLAAERLQEAANGGDRRSITMQFAKVGKVCSGCHTDYRMKQESKGK